MPLNTNRPNVEPPCPVTRLHIQIWRGHFGHVCTLMCTVRWISPLMRARLGGVGGAHEQTPAWHFRFTSPWIELICRELSGFISENSVKYILM